MNNITFSIDIMQKDLNYKKKINKITKMKKQDILYKKK